MGQKVDPNGLRTGVIKPWNSTWYADKAHFADNIVEDSKVRKFIKKKYYDNAISKITIERAADKFVVGIYTSRPLIIKICIPSGNAYRQSRRRRGADKERG